MTHFGYVWVESDKPHYVYRLFDARGALLYIGMSQWPHWRMEQHRDKVWWDDVADWTVEEFPNRRRAATAERAAIRAEHPVYNGQHNEHNPNRKPSLLRPRVRPTGVCAGCGGTFALVGGKWGPLVKAVSA